MVNCKKSILRKFEKNQDKLATVDSEYLLGKTKRTVYLNNSCLLTFLFSLDNHANAAQISSQESW